MHDNTRNIKNILLVILGLILVCSVAVNIYLLLTVVNNTPETKTSARPKQATTTQDVELSFRTEENKEKEEVPLSPPSPEEDLYDEAKVVECVQEWEEKFADHNLDIVRGHVAVTFQDKNISETDRENIASLYGLSGVSHSYSRRSRIEVPAGEEFLWACRLHQNDDVMFASPNEYIYPQP